MLLVTCLAVSLGLTDLPASTSGRQTAELATTLLPDMTAHRTSRYLVLSDSDRQTIRTVENTLADARRQYDRWCRAIKAPRPRPEERLVCIVFHDRSRFADFARQTEGGDLNADAIGGFFSPRFDWVVFYHPEDAIDLQAAHDKLDDFEQQIEDARRNGASEEAIAEANAQLDAARLDIDFEQARRKTAVSIHEAVHQLVHVGSAFPGRGHWPDWLHEGVAVAFETDDRRRPFGPDRPSPGRKAAIDEAAESNTLLTLTEILQAGPIDHGHRDHTGLLYAQSGALIEWLHRKHRTRLASFLDLAGVPDADGEVPDITDVFSRTIGDPEEIGKAWLRSLSP